MSTSDARYAFEIRRALLEQTRRLPAATEERLADARRIALARKKQDVMVRAPVGRPAVVAPSAAALIGHFRWIARVGAMAPILAGALMFIGLYQFEQQKRIVDVAEIDAAVLADELPLSAYVDHGFYAFVENGGE